MVNPQVTLPESAVQTYSPGPTVVVGGTDQPDGMFFDFFFLVRYVGDGVVDEWGGRKKRWGRGQESSVAERSTFPQGNKEK